VFKRVIAYYILTALVLVSLCAIPVSADTEEWGSSDISAIAQDNTGIFELKSKSALLQDANTGAVLFEKNSHEKYPIASITKIMSMLLIMEAIDSGKLSFDDIVPVSEHAYSMGGSQVYLKPGEEFTVTEMLKAIAIHSANDATVAVAEKIAGSEEAFVNMMNERAAELGMKDTRFLDCTGLTDDGHYSTASDIAIMSRELVKNHPKVLEFTSIWLDSFRDGTFSLNNTNRLVRFYEGVNGLKTGFTSKAGYCLAATASRNNLNLISVVLGGPDSNTRFNESRKLLDYGFANFEKVKVNSKGEQMQQVLVKNGLKMEVNAILAEDVILLLKKGSKGNIESKVVIEENILAPLSEGQKIGRVIYSVNGEELGTADLVSDREVKKASFIRLFFRMALDWIGIGRP
jgi:D-alanyl-D-alanine carboxypeptidase (penicillin-binding protein 5/6)